MAITISTSTLIATREAEIDGHTYTIRKMGAGTQLDISQATAPIIELNQEAMNLRAKLATAKTEEDTAKLSKQANEILGKIAKANAKLEAVYASLFDDHGDQSKSRELVHMVGADGVQAILAQVFGEE